MTGVETGLAKHFSKFTELPLALEWCPARRVLRMAIKGQPRPNRPFEDASVLTHLPVGPFTATCPPTLPMATNATLA